jgi:hypothetical protein
MKHFIDSENEYLKLTEYLKKLESLAEKFGVDVDDLVNDELREKTMFTLFRKKIHSINQKRINLMNSTNKNNFRIEDRSPLFLVKNSINEIEKIDSE